MVYLYLASDLVPCSSWRWPLVLFLGLCLSPNLGSQDQLFWGPRVSCSNLESCLQEIETCLANLSKWSLVEEYHHFLYVGRWRSSWNGWEALGPDWKWAENKSTLRNEVEEAGRAESLPLRQPGRPCSHPPTHITLMWWFKIQSLEGRPWLSEFKPHCHPLLYQAGRGESESAPEASKVGHLFWNHYHRTHTKEEVVSPKEIWHALREGD